MGIDRGGEGGTLAKRGGGGDREGLIKQGSVEYNVLPAGLKRPLIFLQV